MSEMIIQSPDEVIAFLKAQHNLIEDMFDQVLHATDPKAREKPFVHLRQLLAVHETAEEMVVHPRVRREVDASDSIVDARLEEEHEAKELLSGIEKLDITSQQFIDELTKLRVRHRTCRARAASGRVARVIGSASTLGSLSISRWQGAPTRRSIRYRW